jgi:methylphosphotriester-DNA--protein-cysteine methyltransferase
MLNCRCSPPAGSGFSDLTWEIWTHDNAEVSRGRLARAGVIARSHATDAAVEGDVDWMSQRSVQRHFRRVTGMTFGSHQQIKGRRSCSRFAEQRSSVLNATFDAGYFDQAHLTRSVKQLIWMTRARLLLEKSQLSFSYKTRTS